MPKEKNLEFKVGIFVFIALVSFTIFIFSISDSAMLKEGKTIRVVFNYISGLKKNAPVRVAGVDEGIVEDVNLFFDRIDGQTKVEILIRINKATKIPADSMVMVNQLGMLGEKYVEIIPGLETKEFFEEGVTVIGRDPTMQAEMADKMVDIAKKLDESIAGLRTIITNEENIRSINETLKNIASISTGFNDIVTNIHDGKGTVGKLFYDETLYDNLEGLTADLKANPWKLLYKPKEVRNKR